jgi:hypothetical protein
MRDGKEAGGARVKGVNKSKVESLLDKLVLRQYDFSAKRMESDEEF